jgi:hypothetical protein
MYMNHKRTIRKQKRRYTRYKRHRNLFGVRKGKTRRYKRSQPKRGGGDDTIPFYYDHRIERRTVNESAGVRAN